MLENVETGSREGQYPVLVPGRDQIDLNTRDQLETDAALRRLRRLEEWLDHERMRQAQNRYQQALDDDFYDGLQWSDEDAQALIQRGQAPLVYNKVAPTVRWVTGTEKRTRIDYKVYPRSDDDTAAADAKTKLLKYLQDINKSAFARSAAFTEAMRVGVGWLECGIRADPTDSLIYDRNESWRNILYDSLAQDPMQSDWRYIVRQKNVDLDIAEMLFFERREKLRSAASFSEQIVDDRDDEWYLGSLLRENASNQQFIPAFRSFGAGNTDQFNRRARVKLYEMWYRYPTRVYLVRGGEFNGKEYDPRNQNMAGMLSERAISLYDRVALKMRCAVFIRGSFLQDVASPYRHDKFPFTPIWGNRRARDGMAYGMTRNLRDPQEDFNKRMSKALFAMSTRRIITTEGAVDDWELLRQEAARPDAMLVVKVGHKLELHTDLDIADHHIAYAEIDARMIQDAAGVTDENMGKRTNATSGIAIEHRQEQGAVVTADYFDNLRLAIQLHGEKLLSLCEQFITMPMQIRILGERQGYDFMPINTFKTGADGQPEILNDITASQADFVVSQQDFRESMREAAFETLMEFLTKIASVDPQFVKMLLDDVVEMSNLPGKEEIVATIRELTGKVARDKKLSPEEQQAQEQQKAQQAAEAQQMKALQLRGVVAEIVEKEAKAKQLMAEAEKALAEAQAAGADGGAVAQVQQQYMEKLAKLREDTAKLVAALKDQVLEANRKADDAQAKIASDEKIAREEIASRERIAFHATVQDTGAKVEIAKHTTTAKASETAATAHVDQKIDKVLSAFQDLATEVASQLDQVRLEQEKKHTAFQSAHQADTAKRDKAASDDKAKAQKDAQAKETPPAPAVVVVPAGGDYEVVEKTIDIKTDANGNPTGAVVRETRKPKAKSKGDK